MVYVQFTEDEKNKDLLTKLNINIQDFKFGLLPYKSLQSAVDSYNIKNGQGSNKQDKLYLNQIIQSVMIYMEADREALLREEAENDPKLAKERTDRQSRIQERRYQETMNKDKAKQQGLFGADLREMEKSISFGVSFIFTFFLSGISGYYIGKYFLGLNEGMCMVIAMVALIGTLIMESTLFILKTWKNDKVMKEREGEEKVQRNKMRQTESQEITNLVLEFQKNKQKNASEKKND